MRHARWPTRAALLIAAVAIGAGSTACGYALAGRGNAWPTTIHRVGIPDCKNQTGTPDIDRILTDAMRTEFSGRGKYTVLPQATDVDALVTCTITGLQVTASDFNSQRVATGYSITVTANIEAHDVNNANKTLWANPAVRFDEPYNVTNGQIEADPTSLLRNNSDAMNRLARNFAQRVVTAMLEAF